MAAHYPVPVSAGRGMQVEPIMSLQRQMNRLFDDVFGGFGPFGGNFGGAIAAPRLDVHETDKEICISAEVPGVKADDLDVRVEGDHLTISGESKSDHERNERDYHVMERSFGRFTRTVQLPFAPKSEEVKADFSDGVLTLHVPKSAQQEHGRRIPIGAGSGSPATAGGAPSGRHQQTK